MKVHNKGYKAERERAVLINSYHVMCKDFNVPRYNRLDAAALARLSNEMLFKVNKDLYSQATVKQARKLAVKMGLAKKPDSWVNRLVQWFKRVQYAKA